MARRTVAGSRALVTGASSGIGRALALALARQGADVFLVARREDRLEQLADEVRGLGRRCQFVAGDVTEPATRQAAIEGILREFGGLDILVNNAGVSAMGPFAQGDPARLRRIFEVNFFAPLELIRAAIPALAAGRRPMVVNVGSILSHVGLPNLSEYSASKFALRGFSEVLRAELRRPKLPDGTSGQAIDVLVVSPATVTTEIWDRMLEVKGETAWRAGRGSSPEAVARRIVRAMARGRRELFPGIAPKVVYLLNRLCPRIVAWALERRE
jgi:short-subunit dehydrogenase